MVWEIIKNLRIYECTNLEFEKNYETNLRRRRERELMSEGLTGNFWLRSQAGVPGRGEKRKVWILVNDKDLHKLRVS